MSTRPVQEPITGAEYTGAATTPRQALAEFYAAFNAGDLELMATHWERSEDVAMDNPLGGIKRGWPELRAVYAKLFQGPARVRVEFHDYTLHESENCFWAVGRERGTLRLGSHELPLAIRTTRVFRRQGERWHQVHHHGSIDDPTLLRQYQNLVLRGGVQATDPHDGRL